VFPARCVDVTCQRDAEFPQIVCGPGFPEVFHSLLYRSNRPSGVFRIPSAADEHHAHDAGLVLPAVGDGLGRTEADVGPGLGRELDDDLDADGRGSGAPR
jgi:hypothetical protein